MTSFEFRKTLSALRGYDAEPVANGIIVNANECNWPLPEGFREEIQEQLAAFAFHRYPPLGATELNLAIAAEWGVGPECVKMGNGSSELLQTACYVFGGAGRAIAYPEPSFSMYKIYCQLSDSEHLPYHLNKEGYLEAERVIALCREKKPALLILCNPNNPTGNLNAVEVIEKILQEVECPVLVDEAYMEFAGKAAPTVRPLLAKYQNFICFRTFSKAYGLASLRIGYAVGSPALQEIMAKALLPYHVNGFSLMAAAKAYRRREEFALRTVKICRERDNLAAALRELHFQVWSSATNFLMLAFPLTAEEERKAKGAELFAYLGQENIHVRNFTSNGFLPGALRITVGTPEENRIILQKLQQFCRRGGAR